MWYLEAVLSSRTIVAGRPQLRLVTAIASLAEERLDDAFAREEFWRRARVRLGRLQQLSGRDVEAIECELARRIPKPAATIAAMA